MKFQYTSKQVDEVSHFLQKYMKENKIESMTADDCAELLVKHKVLEMTPPKPGFNFREMLRQGRDKKIPLVLGAHQERPGTRWTIFKI